jgi:hypothetical protein
MLQTYTENEDQDTPMTPSEVETLVKSLGDYYSFQKMYQEPVRRLLFGFGRCRWNL